MRINKSLVVSVLGRFAAMHLIAVNVVMWIVVVVYETSHEIDIVKELDANQQDQINGTFMIILS